MRPIEETSLVTNSQTLVTLTFRDIPLTASTEFQGAWLQLFGLEDGTDETEIVIRGVHNGQPTKGAVRWSVDSSEDWEGSAVWVSDDISELVKEVIVRPEYQKGDSISFSLRAVKGNRRFASYEMGPRFAPTFAAELVSPCKQQ